MTVKPIPDGYPQLVPSLSIDGAQAAIDFYTAVFGATVRLLLPGSDGKVGHCELQIGAAVIMLADEYPEMGFVGPRKVGGTPVTLSLYVEDVDEVFARAIAGGALELHAVQDQFYGDRSGQFEDPFGHRWNVSTHIEDVSDAEMSERAARAVAEG